MGRYSENKAYNTRIERLDYECYRLHWTVDRYYAGSRLRHPTKSSRDTDTTGALRFAKKHGISFDPNSTERFYRK